VLEEGPSADVDAPGGVADSPQALLVVDDECVCVEVSLGACRLLGSGRAEVVGLGLSELLEPGSRDRFAASWPGARELGGQLGTFAFRAPPSVVEMGATVTAQILPSRHLIGLEPAAAPVEPRGLRAPSAREREVLDLLADGATDGQIALALQLSPATVQSHVRNAKAKLGARTRAQAVALALRRGLIGTH
jgi:DNA-binding CsgD family transcriptional regulator